MSHAPAQKTVTAGTLLAHLARAAAIHLSGPLAISLSFRPPLEYVIVVADVRLTPVWSIVWWGEIFIVDSSKMYPHQSEWHLLGPLIYIYHQKKPRSPRSHVVVFSAVCTPWRPELPPSRYFQSSLLLQMCLLLRPGAECFSPRVWGFFARQFQIPKYIQS